MGDGWGSPRHPRRRAAAMKRPCSNRAPTAKKPCCAQLREFGDLIPVGSDCTGLNSMALALEQMKVGHLFIDVF
eukprot:5774110-Pyramimonas_sp.AAC.1